jgi:hypothetical protein
MKQPQGGSSVRALPVAEAAVDRRPAALLPVDRVRHSLHIF